MCVGFIGGKFLPLHMGHVYAITYASNLVNELYIVLSHSEIRDKILCDQANIKYISKEVRLSWLGQLSSKMENVKIIDVKDSESVDNYNWEYGANLIRQKINKPIDIVFSSEELYTPIFNKLYPNSRHVVIDSERIIYPISATEIRNDIYKHWDMIPNFVKPYFIKKVVVVGTESCGKSTLTRNLAKVFNTTYVEEYGRNVCEAYSNQLASDLFPYIAYGHKMNEYTQLQNANKVLFIDSEALITKYYLKMYTGDQSNLYDEIAKYQDYDLWIYLEPDVQWIDDGLRFQGDRNIRVQNNKILKEILNVHNIKYHCIAGNYLERFNQSFELVNILLQK